MNTSKTNVLRAAITTKATAAVAALAALTGLLVACGGGHEEVSKKVTADTSAVIRVVTTVIKARAFEDWGQYSADLRGVDDAVLAAPMPTGGRVNMVAEIGKAVNKGQALCDIDAELYQAQLRQAEAAVELARGEAERAKENVRDGYLGKAATDKAELDLQAARAALFQARRAYADSRCEAPFAGVLVSRFVDKHQVAAPGTQTVRVAALSRLEALVSIPESEAFDYKEGQRAEFVLLQDGAQPVAGRIESIDRAVESRNRVVTARVRIENPGQTLRPGMIGRVRILRQTHENATVVPSQAVLRLQNGTAVMRVRNGLAERVDVVLGASQGDVVLVKSGLRAGDRVITAGAFQVSEGTKVSF
jgi:membrane fusion protein (multidrug efflux system)